jgi:hypothetical protein
VGAGGSDGGVDNSHEDPYWDQVSLLINADDLPDGAGNGDGFIEEANNISITEVGAVKQGVPGPVDGAYAALFNGISYLDQANSSQVRPRYGTYTVEGWFYVTEAVVQVLFDARAKSVGLNDVRPVLWTNTSGRISFWNGSGAVNSPSDTYKINTWHHIVLERVNNVSRIWVDGVLVITNTASLEFFNFEPRYGARVDNDSYIKNGGMLADWRISTGAEQYPDGPLVPTAPIGTNNNTKSYLRFSNVPITDLTGNNQITAVNGAKVSTAVHKYGTGSVELLRSASSYLSGSNPSVTVPANVPFTAEAWIRPSINLSSTGVTSGYGVISLWGNSNATRSFFIDVSSSGLRTGICQGSDIVTLANGVGGDIKDRWSHVAFGWDGATFYSHLNGQLVHTHDSTQAINSDPEFIRVGHTLNSNQYFDGYIDEVRITKGICRYTADFTPPEQHPVGDTAFYESPAVTPAPMPAPVEEPTDNDSEEAL